MWGSFFGGTHDGEGEREGAHELGRGNELHRIQLPGAAGVRFSSSIQNLGREGAAGWKRSVGQHHRRHRAHPQVLGEPAHGITFPLLVRSDGQKFGKSEKGAIWLSPEKLSPYEFYQHLVRVADADVIQLMRMLTFMEMDEIRHYEVMMKKSDYVANTAQKRLAEEVTRIVHGEEALQTALRVTVGLTPGAATELNAEVLESLAVDMPSHTLDRGDVVDQKVVDIIVKTGLQPSKGEARRLIKNGGVSINNQKVEDENGIVIAGQLIDKRMLLLAVGKKNKVLIR